MKYQKGNTIVALLVIFVWLAAIAGWVMNIYKLIDMLDGAVTAMFIARIAGIPLAPLGVVLGYF